MSEIRGIWRNAAPPFPPSQQHPEARRWGPIKLADGSSVFIDAIGEQPSLVEIQAALGSAPAPTPGARALERHLTQSIQQFSTPQERPHMRGMQRLANLTETLIKSMDADADAMADRITAGHARAQAAIGKFGDFAVSIEKTADEIEAALGQITNSPTPPVSGGS